jgi:hypothetical protein
VTILLIVLLVLFLGGGFYDDGRRPYYGGGVGLVVLILLILFLTGNLQGSDESEIHLARPGAIISLEGDELEPRDIAMLAQFWLRVGRRPMSKPDRSPLAT